MSKPIDWEKLNSNGMICMPIDEWLKIPPEPTEPYRSSPWEIDLTYYTLDCFDKSHGGNLSVSLAGCLSSEGRWQRIWEQMCQGASPLAIWHLAWDLDLFLGEPNQGERDVRKVVKKRLARAEALRGRRAMRSTCTFEG